jgi:hypothetical protein
MNKTNTAEANFEQAQTLQEDEMDHLEDDGLLTMEDKCAITTAKCLYNEAVCSCSNLELDVEDVEQDPYSLDLDEVRGRKNRWMCPSCDQEFIPKKVGDSLALLVNDVTNQLETYQQAAAGMLNLFIELNKMMLDAGAPAIANEKDTPTAAIKKRLRWVLDSKVSGERDSLDNTLNLLDEIVLKMEASAAAKLEKILGPVKILLNASDFDGRVSVGVNSPLHKCLQDVVNELDPDDKVKMEMDLEPMNPFPGVTRKLPRHNKTPEPVGADHGVWGYFKREFGTFGNG